MKEVHFMCLQLSKILSSEILEEENEEKVDFTSSSLVPPTKQ
jgi:hypothetical protein